MPTNIEIKARVADLDTLRKKVEEFSIDFLEVQEQQDVFFHTPQGRLKLRIFSENSGQLIGYFRSDLKGSKASNYSFYTTSQPRILRRILSDTLKESVVVNKKRVIFWDGQTRIHLDQVDGLGSFVEFEVVLKTGQSLEAGHEIARNWMAKLNIEEKDLLAGAYADLLGATPRS